MKIIVVITIFIAGCAQEPCKQATFTWHMKTYYKGHRFASEDPYGLLNSFQALNDLMDDQEGIRALEFDVNATKDGIPVVIHDDNTCNVTNRAMVVSKTKYVDLPRMIDGSKIPKLSQVVEIIKEKYQGRARIIVDIKKVKSRATPELVRLVGELQEAFPNTSINLDESNYDNVDIEQICATSAVDLLDQDTGNKICEK